MSVHKIHGVASTCEAKWRNLTAQQTRSLTEVVPWGYLTYLGPLGSCF